MRKNLFLLEELQELDLKIDGRQGERQALLDQIAELERQLEEARSALDAKRGELALVEGEKRDLEVNLATEEENIVRSEVRQKEIKTQKEYQAVVKEIAAARKLKGELEEQILQKVARLDELTADIEAMEADLLSIEKSIAARKTEINEGLDRIDLDIAADRAARENTIKAIPPSLFKRYQTLRERRNGIAVVEAREGSCSGCNMNLPPQLYNTLFRGDDLVLCPHCQRILLVRSDIN